MILMESAVDVQQRKAEAPPKSSSSSSLCFVFHMLSPSCSERNSKEVVLSSLYAESLQRLVPRRSRDPLRRRPTRRANRSTTARMPLRRFSQELAAPSCVAVFCRDAISMGLKRRMLRGVRSTYQTASFSTSLPHTMYLLEKCSIQPGVASAAAPCHAEG